MNPTITAVSVVVWILAESGVSDVIKCRNCHDVDDPASCTSSATCGIGEICVTREYMNIVQETRFRMSCESKQTCDLLKVASSLIGKCDSGTKCHECCESNECNGNLCQSSVTASHGHGNELRICSNSTSDYLEGYYYYGSSRYLIGLGELTWSQARDYCRSQNGDLLVINSKDEHAFWQQTLTQLNATHHKYIWIGGVYSYSAKEWEWMDGEVNHYTPWYESSYNNLTTSSSYQACAVIHNPPYYMPATFTYSECTNTHLFICEMQ